MPAVGFAHVAAQQRRQRRAQVDSHVEDGEAAVAAVVAAGVKRADELEMFGLKKPFPAISRARPRKNTKLFSRGHQRLSASHEQAAQDDGPPRAEQAVGQYAAEERRHVDQGRIGPVNRVGVVVAVAQEALGHVQDQQGPHPVEGEALPHFGEEQGKESCRMPQEDGGIERHTAHVGRRHRPLILQEIRRRS